MPPPPPTDPDVLRATGGTVRFTPRFHVVDVDAAVDLIRNAVGSLPVTDVFFWSSIAGMDDDLVDRHVELVCRELRPRLNAST